MPKTIYLDNTTLKLLKAFQASDTQDTILVDLLGITTKMSDVGWLEFKNAYLYCLGLVLSYH